MDRRTARIQQLMQVSDFLEMQRKAMKGLYSLAHSVLGGNTVVSTAPGNTTPGQPTDAIPTFASMTLTVPPLSIYQLGALDAIWSTLGADTTPFLIQGLNPAGQNFVITPPGPGLSQYFLIEAQLAASADENNQVIPYFAQLQTVTLAGSTVSKIYVGSTVGMADGDQIVIQGFAATAGAAVFVSGTPGSDGGGSFINISPSLAAGPGAPGAGVTVRDVTPNNGAPLAGPGNSGTAEPVDRIRRVTLQIKNGTAAASPTQPTATAGWIPLYIIGPVPNGTSALTGLIAKAANAPFFPGLVGRNHHGGVPGQANKINVDTELSEDLVKVAGDVMTGDLELPHLKVNAGKVAFTGKWSPDVGLATDSDGMEQGLYKFNAPGVTLLDESMVLINDGTLKWLKPGNTMDLVASFGRFATGDYQGTGSANRLFTLGFTPYMLLLVPHRDVDQILDEDAIWVINNVVHDIVIRDFKNSNTQGLPTVALEPTAFNTWTPIVTDGFRTHPTTTVGNQNNCTYRFFALG